ncbi:MAG: ASKHA domain-containing protein [Candidatus Saccharicenans sp.]
MAEIKIQIKAGRKSAFLQTARGRLLSEVLAEAGYPLRLYCQGRGVCGQCFVRIIKGQLPEESQSEKELRLNKRLSPDYRLACQLRIASPLTISLPESLLIKEEISSWLKPSQEERAIRSDFNPLIKKYSLNLSGLSFISQARLKAAIRLKLGLLKLDFKSAALRKLAEMSGKNRLVTAVVYDDKLLLDFEPGDTLSKTFGLAVDLGTTTVSAQLIDLFTGQTLASKATANLQTRFGSDLISRISLAINNSANLKKLQETGLKSIELLISALAKEAWVKRQWIYAMTLAGNPVMNHLFLGLPVESFGHSPFQPAFISHPPVSAFELGLQINSQAMVYLCPNLASFVGGDISSGLLYTKLVKKKGNYLYVDLGTNGEIILKKGRTILATSTAAGPAFEGSGISCGLQAVPGAIEKVNWQNGRFVFKTIGQTSPAGLCGSGLIAALAEALKAGLLAPSGKILKGKSGIRVARKIVITQEDVRKLQLAMAAIKSGLKLLLKASGLKWSELDGLYLAGVFGNSIDLNQCCFLGLLPPLPQNKIFFAGNASLAGARLVLLSQKARREIDKLPGQITFFSLASQKDFQSEFLKALAIGTNYWRESDV